MTVKELENELRRYPRDEEVKVVMGNNYHKYSVTEVHDNWKRELVIFVDDEK